MGKIVAAMATVHAPQLFTRPPSEILEQLDADVAAMAAQDARLRLVDASGTAAAVTGRLLALLEEEEILPLVP